MRVKLTPLSERKHRHSSELLCLHFPETLVRPSNFAECRSLFFSDDDEGCLVRGVERGGHSGGTQSRREGGRAGKRDGGMIGCRKRQGEGGRQGGREGGREGGGGGTEGQREWRGADREGGTNGVEKHPTNRPYCYPHTTIVILKAFISAG